MQFASHTLVDRERNFATNEKEALSCVWAIEHWEKFLLGHHFTLRTDHGALRSLLHQHSSTRKSAKFERWLERLSRFDYTVEHVRGTHNYIADALSRLPRPASEQPPPPAIIDDKPPELQATIASLAHGSISLDAIQRHTDANTLLHQVKEYIRTAWPPKALLPYYNVCSELSIDHECVVRCDKRFVIPASLQCRILHIAHEGHPGIVRAKRSLRATYWWPSLNTHVENFIRHCPACQDSAKAHKRIAMPPSRYRNPQNHGIKSGWISVDRLRQLRDTNDSSRQSLTTHRVTQKYSCPTTSHPEKSSHG